MKCRILMCITAMTLLAALAVPVRLAAQDNQNSNQALAQTFTVLHTFTGSPDDGAGTYSNMLLDVNGTQFGTTYFGGLYGFGTVFMLDRRGKETVLYSFTGGADGALANSNLVRDEEGNLYGATQNGGSACAASALYGENGCGVVFKLDRRGNETVLYSFSGVPDGAVPFSFLTIDEWGNIYGAAQYGGSSPNPEVCLGNGCGVLYKLDRRGIQTVLYTFTGGADGFLPNGPLLLDYQGNLYGTAEYGGDPTCNSGFGCGVVFKLDRKNRETVLHTFSGLADGAFPAALVTVDPQGNLYSDTLGGGDLSCGTPYSPSGCGVVFKIRP